MMHGAGAETKSITIQESCFFQIQLLWWDHGKTESWLRCEVNSHDVPGCRPRLGREDTGRNIEDDLSDAHSLQSRPLHSPQSRLHKWWVWFIQWWKLTFIYIHCHHCKLMLYPYTNQYHQKFSHTPPHYVVLLKLVRRSFGSWELHSLHSVLLF